MLELYRAGQPMRSALKDLIWFYASYINRYVDVGGNTLLHHALCHKDHDMAEFLLECGANPYQKNKAGDMPVHYL